MQFNIDQDTGAVISGWVAPDNPNAIPTLVISTPSRPDVIHTVDRPRPDIRDLALHNTGMVGFFIDDSLVPDLAMLDDISIREQQSQVLLHRRSCGLPYKLFIFDTSMTAAASTAMRDQLGARFSLSYDAIERYSFDTLFGILNNQFGKSIYASGRLPLLRYQNLLRANGFLCVALLRHPFEELALRLEIAQRAALMVPTDAANYSAGLEPLVELMRTTSLGDLPSLQASMQYLTLEQAAVVANPLVKALACSGDDPPDRRHIALALENLAAMQAVGTYARFDHVRASLSEIMREQVLESYDPEPSLAVKEAASVLARIESVRRLLALDLALHSYIEDALTAAESARKPHDSLQSAGAANRLK